MINVNIIFAIFIVILILSYSSCNALPTNVDEYGLKKRSIIIFSTTHREVYYFTVPPPASDPKSFWLWILGRLSLWDLSLESLSL